MSKCNKAFCKHTNIMKSATAAFPPPHSLHSYQKVDVVCQIKLRCFTRRIKDCFKVTILIWAAMPPFSSRAAVAAIRCYSATRLLHIAFSGVFTSIRLPSTAIVCAAFTHDSSKRKPNWTAHLSFKFIFSLLSNPVDLAC
jgi:hypothetical protein